MRTITMSLGFAALLLSVGACFDTDICQFDNICGEGAEGAGASGAGGEGGGGGSGGEGGGIQPGCMPAEGESVTANCGVFVASGSNGDGSQANPFGSLVDAVATLGGADAIYVCGGDTFTGSVDLPPGVSLFGGFDCATWSYAGANAQPTVLGDPDVPAMRIVGAGTSTIMSVRIEAPNAVADGASSIGLVVSEATVEVIDAEIIAGDGMAGAPPPAQEAQLPQAAAGMNGAMAGSTPANAPGGMNTCGATLLVGGFGGLGGAAPSGDGGSGGFGDRGSGGARGIGQSSGAWSCTIGGTNGGAEAGTSGQAGTAGAGGSTLGAIDETGFAAVSGEAGASGDHGHSGGGGGASKANAIHGAGGGGGGAGGCGGNGGPGGNGGGSSIALISIEAIIVLGTGVSITAGNGGSGGDGALGQFRQSGGGPGLGGPPQGTVDSGCAGGAGGNGGHGGNGGGGRGGHAIGIAYTGTAPTGGTVIVTDATAGTGGAGGNNGVTPAGLNGANGVVAPMQEF